MALKGFSTTTYLRRLAGIAQYPLFISAWVNKGADTAGGIWASLDSANDRVARLVNRAVTPARVSMQSRDGSAGQTLNATATVDEGTSAWLHVAGAIGGVADRHAYNAGGNEGTNTTAHTAIENADRFAIGQDYGGTNPNHNANTGIAEVSVWDTTGLSDAQIDTLASNLASGNNPLALDASGTYAGLLRGYWIDSANTITDLSDNGADLSAVGTLTAFGGHPTIDPPPSSATHYTVTELTISATAD